MSIISVSNILRDCGVKEDGGGWGSVGVSRKGVEG